MITQRVRRLGTRPWWMDTERFDARVSSFYISLSVGENAMAQRTSKKSATVAMKAAAKLVAAKAAKVSGARWMAPKAGLYRLPKR